jgi:hypothetical protein
MKCEFRRAMDPVIFKDLKTLIDVTVKTTMSRKKKGKIAAKRGAFGGSGSRFGRFMWVLPAAAPIFPREIRYRGDRAAHHR